MRAGDQETDANTVDTVDVPTSLRGSSALAAGDVIDHYLVGERIGRGGIGEVYRAVDQTLQRTVAIKILRPSRDQARLLAEAQAMAKLADPNIVIVHEAGVVDGRVFIAMELVEGTTLRTWLTPERTWREIVAIYLAAGRGLVAIHDAGLVHRDFKPDNVLVGSDGRPRVADLGLAAREDERPAITGGTPRYMAPEQAAGIVDARSDQFAFAVSLQEALAARAVPARLRSALDRAQQPRREQRWPSLAALLAALEQDLRRRRTRIAAGVLGASLAGLALYAGLDLRRDRAAAPCDTAANRISPAWTPADALLVRARFTATPRPHADATAELVRGAVDRYTGAWRVQRRGVCLASERDKAAELRVRCLDRLVGQLRALTDAFERDPDVTVVDHAVDAVAQVTPSALCATAAGLVDTPPPSAAQEPQVAALRATHDANVVAFRTGHYKPGVVVARDQVARAKALGYMPTLAEALLTLAMYENMLNESVQSETDYAASIAAAGEAHDDVVANTAWRSLIDIAVTHNQLDTARERVVFGRAAAARSGNDPDTDVHLDLSESNLVRASGDYAGALVLVDRALARIAQAHLPNSARATALDLRARMLHALHRDAESLAAIREVVQIWETERGRDHPMVAEALVNTVGVETSLEQFETAERDLARAIAILDATYGPESPSLARALAHRCGVRVSLHELDAAAEDCDRAVAIRTKLEGPDSRGVAATLGTVAQLAQLRGDLSASITARERALAIQVKAFKENHPEVARTLFDLGATQQLAEDLAGAGRSFERGARIADSIHDATLIADGATYRADLASKLGNAGEARVQIAIALAGHEALDKTHHTRFTALNVAVDHAIAGQISERAGDPHAATVSLREAIALMEGVVGPQAQNLVDPLAGLASASSEAGDHHAAVEAARRAIAIAEATQQPALQRADLFALLARVQWADRDRTSALASAQTARAIYAKLPKSPLVTRQSELLAHWLATR